MRAKLTNQEKTFVKEVIETGNKTQSVIKAFPTITDEKYASVKGQRLIAKDRIKNAMQTFADRIKDDKLFKVLDEGLDATKQQGVGGMAIGINKGEIDSVGHTEIFVPDYPTRHKYLETSLKLKSYFPKEGNQTNVQVNINRFKDYE
jgi:hypothetical protein